MGNLVLNRREGQSIWIGDDIFVTVRRIERNRAMFDLRCCNEDFPAFTLPERGTISLLPVAALTLSLIDGEVVQVTIKAPEHVIVDREEVRQRRNNGWRNDK